jgi:transcriptional regulator with XRE-family HTH domain
MQTIGERLEEARKKKGISIREAAEATKIRGDYLQKFESNHFDIGLTEIYTRGFLRTYANFLKVPADRILNDYAALGRGDVRPRQPSREVYGRMDITVASTETAERAAGGEEAAPADPQPSHANRGPGGRTRTGASLPTGPDPAIVFKYIKWGGIALVGIVALLVVWSLVSGAQKSKPVANTPPAAPQGPVVGLIALRPVQVRVTKVNNDAERSDGELIFAGTLGAGETRTVPRDGAIYIKATPPGNLEVEINGRRTNWGEALSAHQPGLDKGEIQAPRAP